MVDQVIGEAPLVGAQHSALRAGVQGLFVAVSAWRTLGTHLARLRPEASRREAGLLRAHLPPGFGATGYSPAPASTADQRDAWLTRAAACRAADVATPSLRLGLDRVASVLDGLGRAANGIALLERDPEPLAFAPVRRSLMPDVLPPLVNGLRVFAAVGSGTLFWVATSWPAGPTFITFLAVIVLLQSPRDEAALRTSVGLGFGMVITAAAAAVVKFVLLPNHEGYGLALVPMAALSVRPGLNTVFTAAATNFIPLLGPSNVIDYDVAGFVNGALAIVGGSVAGIVVLRTIPPMPTRTRTRRLLALTLRDFRGLMARPGRWSGDGWRSRIYGRVLVLPPDAEPVDGSRLLAALTIGLQVIDLDRAIRLAGEGTGLLGAARHALRRGDVAAAEVHLKGLEDAVEGWGPAMGDRAERLRSQAAAREIAETLRTYADYFGAGPR